MISLQKNDLYLIVITFSYFSLVHKHVFFSKLCLIAKQKKHTFVVIVTAYDLLNP